MSKFCNKNTNKTQIVPKLKKKLVNTESHAVFIDFFFVKNSKNVQGSPLNLWKKIPNKIKIIAYSILRLKHNLFSWTKNSILNYYISEKLKNN